MTRIIWPGLVGAAVAGADTVLYLGVILRQDDGFGRRVAFVALQLGVATAAALAGSLAGSARLRLVLLTAASTILFGWSFLGVFTIGMLVFPAAILCWVGAAQAGRPLGSSVVAAAGVTTAVGAFALVFVVLALGS